jgi:hypothetical protein
MNNPHAEHSKLENNLRNKETSSSRPTNRLDNKKPANHLNFPK